MRNLRFNKISTKTRQKLNKNISEILKFFAQLAKKRPSAFSNQNSRFNEFITSEEEEKKTTDGREFFFKNSGWNSCGKRR